MNEFEKRVVDEYIIKIHLDSFAQWLAHKLTEAGFVVVSRKELKTRGDSGECFPTWITEVRYHGKLVAKDDLKHFKEEDSLFNVIGMLLINKRIPDDISFRIAKLHNILLNYLLQSRKNTDDLDGPVKMFIGLLSSYDNEELPVEFDEFGE